MVNKDHGDFVFFGGAETQAEWITLPADEWAHITRVKRRREGEEVFATDGKGLVCRCIITEDRRLRILDRLPDSGELPFTLRLICGMLQGDAARDVVTSAAPLGVREIVWVRMDRSQESFSDSKQEKLRRIAVQSLKQCGRAWLPEQSTVKNLQAALELSRASSLWVAHMRNEGGREILPDNSKIRTLVVGPEGGFSDAELTMLLQRECRIIHLGSRRLRTELAVAAGLSAILVNCGEFRV